MNYSENWLGKADGGAISLGGYSTADGIQHLFVAGSDGLIRPLEIQGPDWQWRWGAPVMNHHDGIVGLAAYFHAGDGRRHVFAALGTGDIWEAVSGPGEEWTENWLGVLDGGASGLAGYSAPNGLQHLFVAAPGGVVSPLEIGPPHWKWRWNNPIMSRHDEIVGLAAYYHGGDGRQHVFAGLQVGDVWESYSRLSTQVAIHEWEPKEFPISYWWGPPFAEKTPPSWMGTARTRYQQVATAGFTFALPGESDDLFFDGKSIEDLELNLKFLDAAGSTGLKAFVRDTRILDIVAKNKPLNDSMTKSLDSVIADYSGHSALAGYFLRDETPIDGTEFPVLSAIVTHFRANDPGHACFINNKPAAAGAAAQYYKDYIAAVKPFALSYDHYCFLADGTDKPTFFENLDIVRGASMDAFQLPFWVIVLLTRHTNGMDFYRSPTEAEKRFEVMQALAFGAKAVLYYTYWNTLPISDAPGPAIVNLDGSPTPQYEEVRRINADVRAIGRYLLPARSTNVYENGTLPLGGTPPPPNATVTFDGTAPITVGLFDDSPYTYALLANRDYRNTTSTSAIFRTAGLMRLDKATGGWMDVDLSGEQSTQILLAPGDAELYRLISPSVMIERAAKFGE
jgi:hypothetical protein